MDSRYLLGAALAAAAMSASWSISDAAPTSIVSFAVEPGQANSSDRAKELVQALREFRASLPATGRSDGSKDPIEERRSRVYAELLELGDRGLPVLSRGLADPDVQIRRNVALFLSVSSGSGYFYPPKTKLNITSCLPALIVALRDADVRVRNLAAHAVGNIGPDGAPAIPALLALLKESDEGSRISACLGLAGIGPAAKEALPALRGALVDPSVDVRRFAQRAIGMIEKL
jgi:HEAT repeat protein